MTEIGTPVMVNYEGVVTSVAPGWLRVEGPAGVYWFPDWTVAGA